MQGCPARTLGVGDDEALSVGLLDGCPDLALGEAVVLESLLELLSAEPGMNGHVREQGRNGLTAGRLRPGAPDERQAAAFRLVGEGTLWDVDVTPESLEVALGVLLRHALFGRLAQ